MENRKNKSSLLAILSICGVMFSAYVGPGFASGTQTVSYFLTKGWIGVFIGPIVASILCLVFNLLLFEINRIYQPKSYREAYNTIYRPKGLQMFFGTFKEIQVVVVILIALVFILICTFGSTFGLLNIIRYGYTAFTSVVGPVMLIPLIVSVPYRLHKDRQDGILNGQYELVEK